LVIIGHYFNILIATKKYKDHFKKKRSALNVLAGILNSVGAHPEFLLAAAFPHSTIWHVNLPIWPARLDSTPSHKGNDEAILVILQRPI